MHDDLPNHAYYRHNHGGWTAAFVWQITDWSAFWRTPMPLFDRFQAIFFALGPRLIGPITFETDVDYHSRAPIDGYVQHRTRILKWGVVLFEAAEGMTLQPDGRAVKVEASAAQFPFRGWPTPYGPITARVDADARGADYTFPGFGRTVDQRVDIVPGGVDVVQRTAWGVGTHRLRAR